MRRKLNTIEPKVAQENNFLQKYVYDRPLTVNDVKLFKAILSKVKYNDSLFEDSYTIDYSTLDIAGVTKRNRYAEVSKSLTKLMTTFVTIREEDRKKVNDPTLKVAKGNRTLGLIKNDWIHEKNTSKITISIPEILKPFFLELANKEYTIYSLKNICELKSIYELKLYDLYSKWKNRGYFNITLKNLYKYLEIEDGKYEAYSNFRLRILEKYTKTISEHTNLLIFYRELDKDGNILKKRGAGNKVHSIEFHISDKENFDKEKYITSIFEATDNKQYVILGIKENDKGLLELKLFDREISEVVSLAKPITKKEFLQHVIDKE